MYGILTKESMPSVFSTTRSDKLSDKYSFIPTTRILDVLSDEGWVPTSAQQVSSRTSEEREHAKHLIRLRHEDTMAWDGEGKVGETFPELVLFNSHNGRANYQLRFGLYRMICSNGMVVGTEHLAPIRIRHMGYSDDQVVDASRKFIGSAERILDVIDDWKGINMDRRQVAKFGTDAAKLRFADPDEMTINSVLQARRTEDTADNLWTVFNRAQENLLRGGFMVNGGRRSSRAITSIDKNLELNTELWDLASNYSKN